MLSKVAKTRLLKLVDYMSKLPKKTAKHFAMKAWVMHNGQWADVLGHHGIKKASDISKEKLIECGMTACALGWGCTIPAFKKAGLRLEEKEGWVGIHLEPVFEGHHDLDAAEAFFRIDGYTAQCLFGPENADASPHEWAKRARALIKRLELSTGE